MYDLITYQPVYRLYYIRYTSKNDALFLILVLTFVVNYRNYYAPYFLFCVDMKAVLPNMTYQILVQQCCKYFINIKNKINTF